MSGGFRLLLGVNPMRNESIALNVADARYCGAQSD
jgi:hypothetical protein